MAPDAAHLLPAQRLPDILAVANLLSGEKSHAIGCDHAFGLGRLFLIDLAAEKE